MIINKVDTGFNFANDNAVQKSNNTPSFGKYLKDAVDSANEAQINADNETTKMITGESEDIHKVLLATEEARLQMELVMEIRNKLLDSYQEISRMQI